MTFVHPSLLRFTSDGKGVQENEKLVAWTLTLSDPRSPTPWRHETGPPVWVPLHNLAVNSRWEVPPWRCACPGTQGTRPQVETHGILIFLNSWNQLQRDQTSTWGITSVVSMQSGSFYVVNKSHKASLFSFPESGIVLHTRQILEVRRLQKACFVFFLGLGNKSHKP